MNLPNKITLTRIFLIPVFVLFFYLDVLPYHELYAAAVFAVAACTDFLDGYIARKYHLVTNMGKFLDPIADKVLVSTAFIVLLTRPLIFSYHSLAGWGLVAAGVCVALIMARELIVSGFRLVAVEKGAVIAADKLGKVKTTVQDVTIVVLLCVMPFLKEGGCIAGYEEPGAIVGMALLLLAALLTAISGVNYIVKNRQVLREESKGEKE